MAGKFIILVFLCLVASCSAQFEMLVNGGDPPLTTAVTTPEGSNTTDAPTTPAGETTVSSAPPTTNDAGGTTASAAPTTTDDAGGTGTTVTQPSGETTIGETVATTKPQPTPDPCIPSQCSADSTCEPRNNNTFVCLCLAGDTYNYDDRSCEKAKVFPGELSLTELKYSDKMKDKQTKEFQDAADTIVAEVKKGFESNKDFSGATVLELQPLTSRAEGVKATVEITFKADATIDEKTVNTAIEKAVGCTDCFAVTPLCNNKPCEEKSTTCKSKDGEFNCTCNDGYVETSFSSRVCLAACSTGEEQKDGKCIPCSFGYTGFNCEDSWQLTLTIVGSVLGGLLLVTLILLPVVALKFTKKGPKKSKEKEDIGMSQVNNPNIKAPMTTSNFSNPANGTANGFANAGVQRFPRATTNNWESRTNLNMTPSNSRQNLISAPKTSRYDDDDDVAPYAQARPQSSLYSQVRPQNNPYAQTRPQSNPYAQTRPQGNPYASSQGQSGSYFAEDVGRRY